MAGICTSSSVPATKLKCINKQCCHWTFSNVCFVQEAHLLQRRPPPPLLPAEPPCCRPHPPQSQVDISPHIGWGGTVSGTSNKCRIYNLHWKKKVRGIPAGDGKIANLFYSVSIQSTIVSVPSSDLVPPQLGSWGDTLACGGGGWGSKLRRSL